MAKAIEPKASDEDIMVMEQILKAGKVRHKYAVRIQTVLNRVQGRSPTETAAFLGIDVVTVSRHVRRFNEGGVEALTRDKTRPPGKSPISVEIKNEISRIVCTETPGDATQWSVRTLANRMGISHMAVQRILQERGLKPHRVEGFQFSTDPNFEQKLEDVVGLYLNPPENSIVFCVDEKSQIQALERTQPLLPLRPGVPARQTSDYKRHGTTTLFAALNVATGKVIGETKETHKSSDYISFLERIDRKTPKSKTLHIILDNYSAHKSQEVKDFLKTKSGRFVEHFIPTHSSWLNLVERWFAEITTKQIRRESWTGVNHLNRSIAGFIRIWNDSGKKFQWVKTSEQIKSKIARAKSHYAE